MIIIKEGIPTKLSGITSLYITFDYNPKIIEIIKQCSSISYNKVNKVWEVTNNNLSFLLKELNYLDDIDLTLLDEKEETHNIPILTYKTKPFEYQEEGITYGLNHNNWLLLDEMGLGKTKTLINLAEELKAQRHIEHCLVVCGINTIKTNWKKEVGIHSNLDAIILGEKISKNGRISYTTIKERANQLKEPIDEFFIITNIESLRNDEFIEAFNNSKNKIDMIIMDEIHRVKNPSTRGSKACLQSANLLKLNAKYKIGATGTILLNSPIDCFIPLKWLGIEHSTLTEFKHQYCNLDRQFHIVSYKNLDLLKDELESVSLRRTKDLLPDLPPKTIINEYVDLSDSHRKFYQTITSGIKEEMAKLIDKVDLTKSSVLGMVTRLRQATVLPSLLSTQDVESSKIERAVDIAEQLITSGEKVVIFSTFKEPCRVIAEYLKEYNPLVVNGDTKDSEINNYIDLFNTDMNYKVFICTISKCGTGLSLHKQCSNAIFLDCAWTSGLQSQAEDRINRLGSTKPCFIYRLICTNTIDEAVANILDKKEALSDYVVDDKVDDKVIQILTKYIEDL